MIKVTNEVRVYEIDGNDNDAIRGEKLLVKSHGIISERIILSYSKTNITVIAEDLEAAIKNARNVRKF